MLTINIEVLWNLMHLSEISKNLAHFISSFIIFSLPLYFTLDNMLFSCSLVLLYLPLLPSSLSCTTGNLTITYTGDLYYIKTKPDNHVIKQVNK